MSDRLQLNAPSSFCLRSTLNTACLRACVRVRAARERHNAGRAGGAAARPRGCHGCPGCVAHQSFSPAGGLSVSIVSSTFHPLLSVLEMLDMKPALVDTVDTPD